MTATKVNKTLRTRIPKSLPFKETA